MKFRIYRYDPDKDDKPYIQDYDGRLEPTDRMLLDALVRIKAAGRFPEPSPLLPRRRVRLRRDEHQRQERPGVHHQARRPEAEPSSRPLPGLPVIRDLIVDMTQFFKQYHSIKPYLVNADAGPGEGAPAVARRARGARRALRVHPVRLLLDLLPVLLVEPGQVRGSRRVC
jgi:succinate dehydrogenase / fumarate reductase iron-sulfur subunit